MHVRIAALLLQLDTRAPCLNLPCLVKPFSSQLSDITITIRSGNNALLCETLPNLIPVLYICFVFVFVLVFVLACLRYETLSFGEASPSSSEACVVYYQRGRYRCSSPTPEDPISNMWSGNNRDESSKSISNWNFKNNADATVRGQCPCRLFFGSLFSLKILFGEKLRQLFARGNISFRLPTAIFQVLQSIQHKSHFLYKTRTSSDVGTLLIQGDLGTLAILVKLH